MANPPFESKQAMKSFVLESVNEITTLLKTIDHPRRFQILALLIDETMQLNRLAELTSQQKSALGNHLSILVDRNLVEKLDRGLYRLTSSGEQLVTQISQSFLDVKMREHERWERLRRRIGRYTTYYEETTMKEEEKMPDFEVQIVRLEPMRVASVRAISKTPEDDAWKKMHEWSESKGLLSDLEKHPVFGFNNPSPSPDHEEYGYEFWIRVDPDLEPEGEIEIKEFKGGLYAVTTCKMAEDPGAVSGGFLETWKKLSEWVKSSKYEFSKHQWLEKHPNPLASDADFVLELYCPIKE